jgi:formate dehydrogenase gamma subunit
MSQEQAQYKRFDKWQRIQHALLIFSFTTLSITGLPQMYADSGWGEGMIWLFGGIESTRIMHRAAATLLMIGAIFHGAEVTYRVMVRRVRLTMLPTMKDITDFWQSMAYNVGLVKEAPALPRYNFGEKAEYWAVIWGTVIMIITGFMLWNPIATTTFLPGQIIPAAKTAHGGEALLAVLSILTWHAYHVHIKFFNRSMFTGYLRREIMEEEHGEELEAIERGDIDPPPEPEVLRRRSRVFYPIATVITLLLLTGLYFFVTFEETAIATLPQRDVESVVPAETR